MTAYRREPPPGSVTRTRRGAPLIELGPDEARERLLAWHGLRADRPERGDDAVRAVLGALGMIQLDPLEPIGTNADLVVAARTGGTRRGQVYDALLPGHGFEHFAKERCLLPADAFPAWRDRAIQAPWWRLTERLKKVDEAMCADVLAEVADRGPIAPSELADRGRVAPMDWSGWKGTARAATLAIEVLWTRCQVVVAGRKGKEKRYDLPERALGDAATRPAPPDPDRWRLVHRVEAAGLLPLQIGPWWSGLRHLRDHRVAELVDDGALIEVRVAGSRRRWLATPELLARRAPDDDGRLRILGPLDPILWDRALVEQVFGFTYVWEVYKPASQRRWGWYVCPLLHRGRLVGRLEAKVADGRLRVDRTWDEGGLDTGALRDALVRHAGFLGVAPPEDA